MAAHETHVGAAIGPHLGSYAAKQCPVRLQWDIVRPVEPLPTSAAVARRQGDGNDFEAEVVADLAAHFGLELGAPPEDRGEWEAQTVAAMHAGTPVIVGGRLPRDDDGRRVGEPDLLVRVGGEVDGVARYRPVDVKGHLVVDTAGKGFPAVARDLGDPDLGVTPPAPSDADPSFRRKRVDDLIQLAHYHRMLEACGHAAEGPAWGGIIGTEGHVLWAPLGHAMTGRRGSQRSILDIYDDEFAFRLRVAARATDPDRRGDLIVVPLQRTECAECHWRDHCSDRMEEADDVSLVPGVSVDHALDLRRRGVRTRLDLARLDPADLDGAPKALPTWVAQARAHHGPAAAYLAPGVERLHVPRADVEIDLDIEHTDTGVYLWGVLVDDRTGTAGIDVGYQPFLTWDPDLATAEVAVFRQFWSWLHDTLGHVASAGLSATVQVWSQATEARQLRRLGTVIGVQPDTDGLVASDVWVDLYDVVRKQLVTGGGLGLKEVAPLAGHVWRDGDAGGYASLEWHAQAVAGDRDARERLLVYNEDDVRATARVRDWLAGLDATAAPRP